MNAWGSTVCWGSDVMDDSIEILKAIDFAGKRGNMLGNCLGLDWGNRLAVTSRLKKDKSDNSTLVKEEDFKVSFNTISSEPQNLRPD